MKCCFIFITYSIAKCKITVGTNIYRNVLFNNYKFTYLPAMFTLSHDFPTRFVHTGAGGSSGVKVSEATQESRQQKGLYK